MMTPQRHDCAVVFSCDRNYFLYALFMIRQIAYHNPKRQFDIVVASPDDLEAPDWARDLGLVVHRLGDFPVAVDLVSYRGSQAPLFKLLLSRELGDRYRRLLYLDCDMFVDGGDLNRLIEVDLGEYPIAAVLDAPFMYEANYQAKEFARLGWPAGPYANTGLQVIDTRAYVEQELERRSFDVLRTHRHAIVYSDQSLTNIALRGKFARLAPCWNWQWNHRFPLVAMGYPVFIRHFIGPTKPDRDPGGTLDVRFYQAYREFLSQFLPEKLSDLPPYADPAPVGVSKIAFLALQHMSGKSMVAEMLARYPDPYKTVL